jgi:hypothetical protein
MTELPLDSLSKKGKYLKFIDYFTKPKKSFVICSQKMSDKENSGDSK